MAFSWEEFLEIARYLSEFNNGQGFSNEAAYRTGISRAYYAVYCYANDYAVNKLGYKPSGKNQHRELIEFLKGIDSHKEASSHLLSLRRYRVQCDYYNFLDFDPANNIKLSIKLAESLISKFKL